MTNIEMAILIVLLFEYVSVGHISDIIDIIDKYGKGGAE